VLYATDFNRWTEPDYAASGSAGFRHFCDVSHLYLFWSWCGFWRVWKAFWVWVKRQI